MTHSPATVGTALTTLLVAREPDVKQLLGIPDQFSTACHITAGYPARPFPRKLHRPEVPGLAFADKFGVSLHCPDQQPAGPVGGTAAAAPDV